MSKTLTPGQVSELSGIRSDIKETRAAIEKEIKKIDFHSGCLAVLEQELLEETQRFDNILRDIDADSDSILVI